jgi:HPt (histidine-containing phosphotransfer) domain-containing protein
LPSRGTPAVVAPSTAGSPALEGLDVEATLQRLGVDRASLDRMLVRFADGQHATLEQLAAAVAAGDHDATAKLAHAVAGAAGNLGADGLRAAAKALEQAGRDRHADLAALLTSVQEHARVVLTSIETLRPAMTEPGTTPGRPFDPGAAAAALDRLGHSSDPRRAGTVRKRRKPATPKGGSASDG